MHYCTLYQVREYLGLGATETQDDNKLKTFIAQSVSSIDRYCGRRFDVRYESRSFDYPLPARDRIGVYSAEQMIWTLNRFGYWATGRLKLDEDLLELISVTNGDGVAISLSDLTIEPANIYPKNTLKLKEGSGTTWQYDSDGNREQIIPIVAYWGYHDRYTSDAWVDSLDTLQVDVSASATTITVSDADGDAGDGLAYRFQAGNMIRLTNGDDDVEYMFIQSINYTTNVLTVQRGYNGTAGVAQTSTTVIYVYRPADDIVLACTRLVSWRYRQKDADSFNREILLGTGEMIIPTDMPSDVQRLLPAPKRGRELK